MSELHNNYNPWDEEESEEERRQRKLHEFVDNYFSIREKMNQLEEEGKISEANCKRFVSGFVEGLKAMVIDFNPDMQPRALAATADLIEYAEEVYYDVENLCEYDTNPAYHQINPWDSGMIERTISGLEIDFSFETTLDWLLFQTDFPVTDSMLEFANEKFEEEYVEAFCFQCFRKHMHLLLKNHLTACMSKIYDLSAEGFRKLELFTYFEMEELFNIVRNAETATD